MTVRSLMLNSSFHRNQFLSTHRANTVVWTAAMKLRSAVHEYWQGQIPNEMQLNPPMIAPMTGFADLGVSGEEESSVPTIFIKSMVFSPSFSNLVFVEVISVGVFRHVWFSLENGDGRTGKLAPG